MSKTSEIVLNWLNNEINLRPKITDISKSFSNGYHLAEIFYILKLISTEEFSQFVNTQNLSDKKSNFSKIEKICQKLFNLIIPEEEINMIIKKDYSKAVVLLYKIRNCIYKNNIHFNEIKIFGDSFSDNEIQNQIKEIIKRQFYTEEEEEEEEENEKSNNDLMRINESNYEENNKSEKFEEEKNFKFDDIKEKIDEYEEIENNLKKNLTKSNKNTKRKLPSIKIKKSGSKNNFIENFNNTSNRLLLKPKNILAPINQRLLKSKSNSCENIFLSQNKNNQNNVVLFRNTSKLDFLNGTLTSKNSFNSQLIDIGNFNKQLEDLGVTSNDYKIDMDNNSIENNDFTSINIYKNKNLKNKANNSELLYDTMYKTKTLEELRNELKNKIKYRKIENKIRQKEIKNELNQKTIDDSKTTIDFLKINKNKFLEKNKTMSLLFKNYSNQSVLRRLEYSKILANNIEKEKNNEKKFYFNKSYQKQIGILPMVKSEQKFNLSKNKQSQKEKGFNSKKFFEKMDKLNYITNKLESEERHRIKDKHSTILKDIVLFIIDMAMEGYFYQKDNNNELMDLKTYLKFNIYFLKNKPLRKKLIIIEDNEYKTPSKLEENIDIDKLISSLTNEEKYLVLDYIYYLGIWNDERIYDEKLRGLKLDYKYINSTNNNNNINPIFSNYFGIIDYEPTVLENEDLTLPKYNIDNYNLGNTILDVLENKFYNNQGEVNNNEIKLDIKENNELNNLKKNDMNINISKWSHIPYKIALVGYPLSGRKTVAEKINSKYTNIKIYSIQQIIRDYYQLFLKYSDPPEKPTKNKNTNKKKPKKNEKEKEKNKGKKENIFEKQERQKKLKEMQPIIDLIQPYIDYQQNINNLTSSINNISKVENTVNNNELFIMSDENLCKLLIKKVEEDFPFISQEKINKNIIDLQKNIYDLHKQIEATKKRKLEAKKPNPKDDLNIEKFEKEIINLKEKSICGFILVDFPTNINQCYLLENYLTGFIEDKRKPKLEKNTIIENISSIIDFKTEPKEKKIIGNSGLNFLVHISTKENIIDERFNSIKYDPVEDKIYTKSNLDFISDKKVLERIIDENPYLPRDLFEYYKEEYNNNINKIISLYSQFGFSINATKEDSDGKNEDEKLIKTYQFIESEEINQIPTNEQKGKKNRKNISKKKQKKTEKDKNKNKEIVDKNIEITTNSNSNESSNKDKVFHFITMNIIEKVFKQKEKYEQELFYAAYPEYKKKLKTQNISELDLNIKEIKTKYKNKSPIKQIKDSKLLNYDLNKTNFMIKELTLINSKYKTYLAKFIHFTLQQKKDIYSRFKLIQTKFRNYLNKKTNKRKIISNFVNKYNHIYKLDPNLLSNEKVINEVLSDIEIVRTEIWKIINKKQNLSINELKEIKNCGFIESELIKFYFNIKDLILLETEKFLIILNNIIILYTKKKEREKENINDIINEFKIEIELKKESILKDTKPFKYYLNLKKEPKFEMSLYEITEIILDNIETMFKNSIKLLFSYNEKINNIFKRIKKIIYNNTASDKKSIKSKKRKRKNSETQEYSLNMVNDLLTNKEIAFIQEENIKNMFLDEKNKYKFRICYIKCFAVKYIQIMKCTNEIIFNNMDEWIVKNVSLQNESLNYLIKILKQFLDEKNSIDQQNDLDYIELDEFEKVIDDEEINNNNNSMIKSLNNNSSNISNFNNSSHEVNLKPFDNSSVVNSTRIYNKVYLEYLLNENFIETKIEEYIEPKDSKNKPKTKIRIIPISSGLIPNIEKNLRNNTSTNEDINSSSAIFKKKYILKDSDFYFDIEKFKFIYKLIKRYEIEDGYLNKEIFFQIFIKQFLFAKRKNYPQNKKKEGEEEENIFENDKNINANMRNHYNEEINIDIKYKKIDNNNSSTIYPAICKALKELRAKQIQRMLDIFIINIDKLNYITFSNDTEKENDKSVVVEEKEEKKENDSIKRKDKKKPTNRTKKIKDEDIKDKTLKPIDEEKSRDKSKKRTKKIEIKEIKEELKEEKEKEIENQKIENKKEKNNSEYETYLNTKEIFTVLSLIGVKVLTSEMEEKIENELKDKYIFNKYLTKKDFIEYKFWFETFFDYLDGKNENEDKIKGASIIKEFLFDIWKNDDNSSYFDFKKFLESLKVNKYITDYADLNGIKYYDILFE